MSAPARERWPRGRSLVLAIAAAYLAGVWLEGVGSSLPSRVLPRVALYFLQIAALFPRAATHVIDYRVEAWLCRDHAWREIDARAYFPLDPDDKENRFQRLMHFFRTSRPVMRALDDFIVERRARGTGAPDGLPGDVMVGGVRTLSLRLPLPLPGMSLERYARKPLADYPTSWRTGFYRTPRPLRADRCGEHDDASRDGDEYGRGDAPE